MNKNICSNSALLHLKKRQKWCYEKFLIQVQVSFSGLILKISLLYSDNSGYFHKFCCTFNLLLFQYVHLDSMLETWKNANDFLTVTNFIIIWITEKLKKPKGSIRWDIFICPQGNPCKIFALYKRYWVGNSSLYSCSTKNLNEGYMRYWISEYCAKLKNFFCRFSCHSMHACY